MLLNIYALAALILPAAVSAHPHANTPNHHSLARRNAGEVELFRRVSNSKWTWYNTETGQAGSCGKFIKNSEYVVALNDIDMKKSLCFKQVRLTFNGKSRVATIGDTCPGCPAGALDLSRGLFLEFAAHSVGVIHGSWEYVNGNNVPTPAPKPPKTTVKPKTTLVPAPAPPKTRTKAVPKPSTTSVPVVAKTRATVTSVTTKASPKPSTTLAIAAIQTPKAETGNIGNLYSVFVQIAGVAAAAKQI